MMEQGEDDAEGLVCRRGERDAHMELKRCQPGGPPSAGAGAGAGGGLGVEREIPGDESLVMMVS